MRKLARMRDFDIAVVGGGASGALTAAWLLRQATAPLSVALLEQSGRFGTGAAYETRQPIHLLNVPAARMSVDPQDPEHLLRWLRRRGHEVAPDAFIPRALFGDYLQDFLGEAEVRAAPGVELHRIPMEAVGFDADRHGLRLASGELLQARQVVLAIGNLPPSPLPVPGFGALAASDRYLHTPWSTEVRQLPPDASLTLIGAGLTAVDLLLSLEVQGHRGAITVLSRHALLPRPHAPRGELPSPPSIRTPAALLRWIRTQPDWRAAVDALRPLSGSIWNGWSDPQRRRFDRHLRHHWDVHRHRMAPQIARRLETLFQRGNLHLRAGRLAEVALTDTGVRLRLRHGEPVESQWVINCTGPAGARASPLLQSLGEQGLARFDRYGLLTAQGRVLDGTGAPQWWLHALGPLRRSELWETTAIPEIRDQAHRLAQTLLRAEWREQRSRG